MSNVREYKCPNCGGGVTFDSSTQQMKCPYCDTTFEVDAVKAFQDAQAEVGEEEFAWEAYDKNSGTGDWAEGETDGMRQFRCQSCGGEIITDANTAATSCPYCGNAAVIEERLEGMFRPDWVIPFQLDKDAAVAAFAQHIKGKMFLPAAFKTQNNMEEIKGMYVPFWLFDADAKANASYRCTKVRHWSDARYNYTKTSYFAVQRAGDASFRTVPVDGSSKMEDALMESIEPFDYNKKVDFQTAYLSGYLADKYDVDATACQPRANERIKTSMQDMLRETVQGYTTCMPEDCRVRLGRGKTQYALLPVWVLNTRYRDKIYTFAMNGQSGKMIGDLPIDIAKSLLYSGSLFLTIGALASLFLWFGLL